MSDNMLSGYGSISDLKGADGLYNTGLMENRVVVHLHRSAPPSMGIGLGLDQGVPTPAERFSFEPGIVTIETGTTVTFYADGGHHTLVSTDASLFPQPITLIGDQIYSVTFLNPNVYVVKDSLSDESMMIHVTGKTMSWADVVSLHGGYLVETTTVQQERTETTTEITTETETTVITPAPVEVLPERTAPRPVRVRDRDMK